MRLAVLILLAGCGRVDFDPLAQPRLDDAPPDAATVPAGPAVWLKMDSGPAGGIIDSARGHAVSCPAACPVAATGVHGGAYRFSSEEIAVTDAPDLDSSAGFTAALWINVQGLAAAPAIACPFTKSFDPASGYDTFALCVDSSGKVELDGEAPAGAPVLITGPMIEVGTWHHLAAVWDGATRRLYLDGAEVGSDAAVLGSGTQGLEVGGARGMYFQPGLYDDLLYYTRPLSAAEIAHLATP